MKASSLYNFFRIYCLLLLFGILLEIPFFVALFTSDAYMCRPLISLSWLGCIDYGLLYVLLVVYVGTLLVAIKNPHRGSLYWGLALLHFVFYGGFYSYHTYFNTNYVFHNHHSTFVVFILIAFSFFCKPSYSIIQLLRLPLVLSFFGAGVAKLMNSSTWVTGDSLKLFLVEAALLWDRPGNFEWINHSSLITFSAVFVVVFELSFPLVFLHKTFRRSYLLAGLIFHCLSFYFLGVNFFSGFAAMYIFLLDPPFLSNSLHKLKLCLPMLQSRLKNEA